MRRTILLASTKMQPRQRVCRACGAQFNQQRSMQVVCSPACAQAEVARKNEKVAVKAAREDRKTTRAKLNALKSRATLAKEAQQAVNAFVRARDAKLPCVSCGRWHDGQWHAGHYRSVGSRPDLRFDEANIHRQCAPCNNHLSGNVVPYRGELLRRIGPDELARLEGPAKPDKLTRDELLALPAIYRAKLRALTQKAKDE